MKVLMRNRALFMAVMIMAVLTTGVMLLALSGCGNQEANVAPDGEYDEEYMETEEWDEDADSGELDEDEVDTASVAPEVITAPQSTGGDLIQVRYDPEHTGEGKVGAIDRTGKQIVPYEWDRFLWLGADRYMLCNYGDDADEKDFFEGTVIDGKGNEILAPGKYLIQPPEHSPEYVGPIDLIPAMDPETDKVGYLSAEDGSWAIQPAFENVRGFDGDHAAAKGDNGKWGFIDRKGNYTTKPTYKSLNFSYENRGDEEKGIQAVRADGKTVYVLPTGEELVPPKGFDTESNDYLSLKSGCAIVWGKEDTLGVVDKSFNEILPTKYGEIHILRGCILADPGSVDEGGEGACQIYDLKGKPISGEKYDMVTQTTEECAVVTQCGDDGSELFGLIGGNGKPILKCRYGEITVLDEENDHSPILAQEPDSGLYSLYDGKGKRIVKGRFDCIAPFGEDFIVGVDGKYALADSNGEIKKVSEIECYDDGSDNAEALTDSLFAAEVPRGEDFAFVVMDRDLNVVSDQKYERLWGYDDGTIYGDRDGRICILNDGGEEVVSIEQSGEFHAVSDYGPICAPDPETGKYALFDKTGQITEFKYGMEHFCD